jgi:hypothetical protein
VGVPSVVRVVGAVLQAVRLLFSSVGRGWATGAGVNDVLAHLPLTLDKHENPWYDINALHKITGQRRTDG